MLEFIASLVDSLAWPGLIAYLVFLFKGPLSALLNRLSSFKYKELEAEFRETLAEIEMPQKELGQLAPTQISHAESVTLAELADTSPRAAVMESWIRIERATAKFLESIGLDKRMSYQGLRRLPSEHLSRIEHILTPYQELRLLRNKAVHGVDADLSPKLAKEYIEVASKVERAIIDASR